MIPSKSQQNILAVFSCTLGFSVTNCINIFQTGEFEGLNYFFKWCLYSSTFTFARGRWRQGKLPQNIICLESGDYWALCKSEKGKYLPHTLRQGFWVSQADETNALVGCSLSFILSSHILLPETKQILINYFSEPLIKISAVRSWRQKDQSVEPETLSSSNIQK